MRLPLSKSSTVATKQSATDTYKSYDLKQPKATLNHPRIVSLLPFLTDIVRELGLQHLLVGVSHECDPFPKAHASAGPHLPCITSSKLNQVPRDASLEESFSEGILDAEGLSAMWNSITASGTADLAPSLSQHLCSFYQVDIRKIAQLNPTVILTQLDSSPRTPLHPSKDEICQAAQCQILSVSHVLAVSDEQFSTVRAVLGLHEQIAELTGHPAVAKDVVADAYAQLKEVEKQSFAYLSNRDVRVAVVQWPTPLYIAGGWVSSLVNKVFGPLASPLSSTACPSACIEDVKCLFQCTNVIIFALCALDISQTRRAVAPIVARAMSNELLDQTQTVIAIVDGRRLFAWLGASNVVQSAQVLYEIVTSRAVYGHKGRLWEPW